MFQEFKLLYVVFSSFKFCVSVIMEYVYVASRTSSVIATLTVKLSIEVDFLWILVAWKVTLGINRNVLVGVHLIPTC